MRCEKTSGVDSILGALDAAKIKCTNTDELRARIDGAGNERGAELAVVAMTGRRVGVRLYTEPRSGLFLWAWRRAATCELVRAGLTPSQAKLVVANVVPSYNVPV